MVSTKKINIFLASSLTAFSKERLEIENFIRNISDEFEERYDVKLQPLLRHNATSEPIQALLGDCEFCFFIFFTKLGEQTPEEFEAARKQFEAIGRPKIYTYFKEVSEEEAEQSLRVFIETLSQDLQHYYSTFAHIDTVKLRILLSVKLQEMDFLEIKAEDGHCVVNGQKVLSLANVAEFANNQQLNAMQRELADLEEEYFALKAQYHNRVNDTAFYSRYSEVASRRQTLMDEIAELQGLIFNMSLQMVRDDARGEITPRQKKAYQLFEQGDYEGCMAVLNADDIDNDFLAQRKRMREQEEAVCRKYIREHKTAIDILLTMKKYEGRFAEIEARYEKILPIIFEMGIELDTAGEFVDYLCEQNQDARALPIAEQLLEHCTNDEDRVAALHLLGVCYYQLNMPEQDEHVALQAVAICEALVEENPDRFKPMLAKSYHSAGFFYDEHKQPAKAEDYYLRAIALREALVEENPERYQSDLSASYNCLGAFYSEQRHPDKAKEFLLKAIAIREVLAAENPDRYSSDLAGSYNNAGVLYSDEKEYEEAEKYYLKAIAIYETLAAENPHRFSDDLADGYGNLAIFYSNEKPSDEAEGFYLKAIAIYEMLAKDHPDRFNHGLAIAYHNAGSFYSDKEKYDKAEELLLKSIAIRESLVALNPERFKPDLALGYRTAGMCYADKYNFGEAEKMYASAITLYETLVTESPDRFLPSLADCYYRLALLYRKHQLLDKAEEFFLKALAVRERAAAENPDPSNPHVAFNYLNAAVFYQEQKRYDVATLFFYKAYLHMRALAKIQPQQYLSTALSLLPKTKNLQTAWAN